MSESLKLEVGDTITATAEVLSVHERRPVCSLPSRVERQDGQDGQDGQVVLEGEAWCFRFIVDGGS